VSVPEQIGPYRVERLLGTGGFASVWLAHDPGLDGYVAIKILADNWSHDPAVRERFVQEGRLLWQLDDERVLRVLTVGELPDGRPYLVTAWADGGSLADRLAGPPMPVGRAVVVLRAIADAVAVLHRRHVVHRDLTPGNVLFRSRSDGAEQVIIAYLGLAKALALSSGITMGTGTPAFTAPEQRADLSVVDERADVFALGMLGRLLVGTDGRLSRLLDRAVSTRPQDRQVDADAFVAELDAALAVQPPSMPATSAPTGMAVPGRRSRYPRLMQVAAGTVALVALGWSVYQHAGGGTRVGPLTVRPPSGWSVAGSGWAGHVDADGSPEPALVMAQDPGRWAADPAVAGAFVGFSPSLGARGVTPADYVAGRRHGSCPVAPTQTLSRPDGIEWSVVSYPPECGGGRGYLEAATLQGTALVYVQVALPAGQQSRAESVLDAVTVAG
jgi:eukaryotic-like serine/threonine-protein kinase